MFETVLQSVPWHIACITQTGEKEVMLYIYVQVHHCVARLVCITINTNTTLIHTGVAVLSVVQIIHHIKNLYHSSAHNNNTVRSMNN